MVKKLANKHDYRLQQYIAFTKKEVKPTASVPVVSPLAAAAAAAAGSAAASEPTIFPGLESRGARSNTKTEEAPMMTQA